MAALSEFPSPCPVSTLPLVSSLLSAPSSIVTALSNVHMIANSHEYITSWSLITTF